MLHLTWRLKNIWILTFYKSLVNFLVWSLQFLWFFVSTGCPCDQLSILLSSSLRSFWPGERACLLVFIAYNAHGYHSTIDDYYWWLFNAVLKLHIFQRWYSERMHLIIEFLLPFCTGEATPHGSICAPASCTYQPGFDEFLLVLQNSKCRMADHEPETCSVVFVFKVSVFIFCKFSFNEIGFL